MQLSCGATVCFGCCQKWIKFHLGDSLSCPCCYDHPLDTSHTQTPPSVLVTLLDGLLVHCARGCDKIVRMDHYIKHLKGGCCSHYQQALASPSRITLGEVLARPTTSPATPAEQRVAEHLVRRILDNSESEDKVVKVPTRGQASKFIILDEKMDIIEKLTTAHHPCTSDRMSSS